MSTIAPKDKAFLDIKLVQECMDAHAERVAIAFGYFISDYKAICFEGYSDPVMVYQRGGIDYTVEQLYNKFIESITK